MINSTFGTEVFSGRGFLVSLFGGESEQPEAVQQALCDEIERVKRKELTGGLSRLQECDLRTDAADTA